MFLIYSYCYRNESELFIHVYYYYYNMLDAKFIITKLFCRRKEILEETIEET